MAKKTADNNVAKLDIRFVKREGSPQNVLAEAEILLPAPFEGLKLVGFTVWKTAKGDLSVTFPARPFNGGSDRKFYDFVRYVDDAKAAKRLKDRIVDEYTAWEADATSASASESAQA